MSLRLPFFRGFTTFSDTIIAMDDYHDDEARQTFLPTWKIGFHGNSASEESRGAALLALV